MRSSRPPRWIAVMAVVAAAGLAVHTPAEAGGDNFHGTTVTRPVQVVDNRVKSTTTLTSSRTSQRFGGPQLATLTATVALGDATVPGGSAEILQDDVVVATLSLVNGTAAYTLPADTPAGAHQYTAHYADSNTVAGSTSAAKTVTVTKATSITVLWSNKLIVTRGGPGPVLTATVLLNSPAAPTGTVTFTVDGVVVGTAPVVNGKATLRLGSNLSLGLHIVKASYSGTPSISGSNSNPWIIFIRR